MELIKLFVTPISIIIIVFSILICLIIMKYLNFDNEIIIEFLKFCGVVATASTIIKLGININFKTRWSIV